MIDLDIIILNIVLFFLFALIGSLDFRKKRKRRQVGATSATLSVIIAETFGFSQRLASLVTFIVQFYISMQGVTVSIYALLWIFGENPTGWTTVAYVLEIPGMALFLSGGLLVIFGWSKIYNAKDKLLVTDGIYKHIRHPQYLGILLACFGLILYKFSPISVMLWPVLVIIYYRLAKKEEKKLENKFGEEYQEYRRRVHMFLPLTFTRRTLE